jgi:hypothetical protein
VVHDLLGLDLNVHGLGGGWGGGWELERGGWAQATGERCAANVQPPLPRPAAAHAPHLPARAAKRLVDHDAAVGHREALALAAGAQQEGAHRRGEAEAVRLRAAGLGWGGEAGRQARALREGGAQAQARLRSAPEPGTMRALRLPGTPPLPRRPAHVHVGAAQHHGVIDAHARGHGAAWRGADGVGRAVSAALRRGAEAGLHASARRCLRRCCRPRRRRLLCLPLRTRAPWPRLLPAARPPPAGPARSPPPRAGAAARTGRVDEQLDVLGRVLLVQQQQLAHDRVGAEVVDLAAEEHDALAQQQTEGVAGHVGGARRHDRLPVGLDPRPVPALWALLLLRLLAAVAGRRPERGARAAGGGARGAAACGPLPLWPRRHGRAAVAAGRSREGRHWCGSRAVRRPGGCPACVRGRGARACGGEAAQR